MAHNYKNMGLTRDILLEIANKISFYHKKNIFKLPCLLQSTKRKAYITFNDLNLGSFVFLSLLIVKK